jgi:REP element-mobilizing transposase RayT
MPFRKKPAHGVLIEGDRPTIVFLSVCTRDRRSWLASHATHTLIRNVWLQSGSWLTGRYVVMPDHLHLFASPSAEAMEFDMWVRYWKSLVTKRLKDKQQRWQTDHWDRRLRREESYEAAWEYVRLNPVRAGLVDRPEDWPFQGEIHHLEW